MNAVRIELFGAFRNLSPNSVLELELDRPCSVLELKARLGALLGGAAETLLAECAFGNETEILPPDALVSPGESVAVLPPVCGG